MKSLLSTPYILLQSTNICPIIKIEVFSILLCILGNDGNGLKPVIKFGQRMKINIGLDVEFDVESVEWLRKHIANEVLVSLLTSVVNKCSF